MKILIYLFLCLCVPLQSFARPAKAVDYGFEILEDSHSIKIKKDGSYSKESKRKVQIINELGRSRFSVYNIYYNKDSDEVQLFDAYTVTNGAKKKISQEYIEDRYLHNESGDFDAKMVKSIAFNTLESNSQIFLHYKLTRKKPAIDGHYSTLLTFGEGAFTRAKRYTFESELPLYFEQNDPYSHVTVKKRGNKTIVQLKSPFLNGVIGEPGHFEKWQKKTFVELSTHKSWAKAMEPLRAKVEERLKDPLPKEFEKFRDRAQIILKKKGVVPMLENLMADLRKKIRYVGDWRTMEGGYVPRELSRIASTSFGDCKDYSISVIKILRELGIKAYFTTIDRGSRYNPIPYKLPTLHIHDHAVVTLLDPETKKERTIDPTNEIAYAKNVLADIVGRTTLVHREDGVGWGKTPDSRPEDEAYNIKQVYQFGEVDGMEVTNTLELTGRAGADLTASELFSTKENIENWFFKSFLNINKPDTWRFAPYNLKDRKVKDLTFKFTYTREKNGMGYTNQGVFFPTPTWVIPFDLPNQDKERVRDFYLGKIHAQRREVLLKGLEINEINSLLNCQVENDWYAFSRQFEMRKEGLFFVETMKVKDNVIPVAHMNSKAYQDEIDRLDKCGYNSGLILPFKSRDTASLKE